VSTGGEPADREALGGYVLGVLDPDETCQVEAHLGTCAGCRAEETLLREVRRALDEIPPEAFLEGPPGDDLLLQRTLRRMRTERRPPAPRSGGPAVAAAAVPRTVRAGVTVG